MATISIPEGMNEKEYYETVVSEEEFLRWYKEQDHPTYENPSVTTDMVAYCFVEGRLKLLVIRRKTHPCQHRVALVGGFLQKHEDAIQACIREVQEEVGLRGASAAANMIKPDVCFVVDCSPANDMDGSKQVMGV